MQQHPEPLISIITDRKKQIKGGDYRQSALYIRDEKLKEAGLIR
jgi:hypothetical protein